MRSHCSALGRVGRGLGVAAVALAVASGASGCGKTVTGTAEAAAGARTTTPSPSGGSEFPSGGNDLSQAARQSCAQLPKDAVTSSFGVTGVTVTAGNGTTLGGGIRQIKCVIGAKGGFRVNVVVQVYPPQLLTTADQYVTVLRQKFAGVRTMTVPGADVAGTFQQTVQGILVDEGFAARKDAKTDTVDVVIVGIADSPGIKPKLVSFVAALAKG